MPYLSSSPLKRPIQEGQTPKKSTRPDLSGNQNSQSVDFNSSLPSSKNSLTESEASQLLLDLNKRPFALGDQQFYYSGFDWTSGVPNGSGTIYFDDQKMEAIVKRP